MSRTALLCLIVVLLLPLGAQHPQVTPQPQLPLASVATTPLRVDTPNHVDAGGAYYRCYAIVPIIGSGLPGDPRRPMFVPASTAIQKSDHSGILGFQMRLSDDKTMALVEFVGANRAALSAILMTTEQSAQVFERGVATRPEIEAAFQKYKKGFTLDSWTPVRTQ